MILDAALDDRDLRLAAMRHCACPDTDGLPPSCPAHALISDPASVRRLVFARHYRRDAMWRSEWREYPLAG